MAGDRQSFDKAMNQGHSAVWDQSWEKAAGYYRLALKEFPDDVKALNSLGLALYESGQSKEALLTYQRAAIAAPEDPIPLEKIGGLLERLGRPDQAVEAYMRSTELYFKARDVNKCIQLWHRVVDINPDYMLAHSRLGYVFEKLGKKPEAVKEYLVMASIFQHTGEMQKALQAVNHALQVLPESVEAGQAIGMLKMGRLLHRQTSTRRPLTPAQKSRDNTGLITSDASAALDPVAAARQKGLSQLAGLLFESIDDGQDSASLGLQAILRGGAGSSSGQADNSRLQLGLSQVVDYLSRKEDAKASEELEHLISAGLDHPAAYLISGLLQGESGSIESAVGNLQRAAPAPDLALGANLYMGQLLLKVNRVQEAAAALLEALKYADMQTVPENQAAQLARLYPPIIEAQATQPIPPKKMCDAILDMLVQPDWLERVRRARQQISGQEAVRGLSPVADLLTEASSGGIVDSLSQIQKLAAIGKYRSAMEEAFMAVEIAPTYLPLHIVMGDLLVKQGQVTDATQRFQMIARSYLLREDRNRAIEIYRHILEFAPMDVQSRDTLIGMLLETRQIEEASSEYIKQSDSYFAQADLVKVRSTLAKALKLAQDNNLDAALRTDLLMRMADIDLQSVDWRQAARTYEQIRTLKPDDQSVRATLVDLYFRLNQNSQASTEISNFVKYLLDRHQPELAEEFVEKLVVDHPDQPLALHHLADLYRQMGRTEEAIQRYDAAGEAYLNAGNKQAAAEAIMALLSLNPSNAAEYQQLLAQIRR
jgi:tetratricopeptide (TPR) repeat protein